MFLIIKIDWLIIWKQRLCPGLLITRISWGSFSGMQSPCHRHHFCLIIFHSKYTHSSVECWSEHFSFSICTVLSVINLNLYVLQFIEFSQMHLVKLQKEWIKAWKKVNYSLHNGLSNEILFEHKLDYCWDVDFQAESSVPLRADSLMALVGWFRMEILLDWENKNRKLLCSHLHRTVSMFATFDLLLNYGSSWVSLILIFLYSPGFEEVYQVILFNLSMFDIEGSCIFVFVC